MTIVINVDHSTWTVNPFWVETAYSMQPPHEVALKISIVVKQRRKSLGISQEQFALMVGIDRTYASQIERSIANPSLAVLCNIASGLEITLCQLLGEMPITSDWTVSMMDWPCRLTVDPSCLIFRGSIVIRLQWLRKLVEATSCFGANLQLHDTEGMVLHIKAFMIVVRTATTAWASRTFFSLDFCWHQRPVQNRTFLTMWHQTTVLRQRWLVWWKYW